MAEPARTTVRLLCDAHAVIGESPVWRNDRVHWTDPLSRRLLSCDAAGRLESRSINSAVWSLSAAEGALLGALDDRLCRITAAGDIEPASPARLDAGCRFNDMTASHDGGVWVGVMHRGVLAARGAIFYARSIAERPVCVAHGLGAPNGMKLSTDGGTLFVIDTLARTLLAFPVERGLLQEPVIVSDFLGLPGKPDGMTIAPDGSFWVAMWGGACIVQLAPDGAFLQQIAIPAPHVSSVCMADRTRLLVTTSRMRLSPQALRDHPGSGGLFEVRLESE